jgi:hypothetical protein
VNLKLRSIAILVVLLFGLRCGPHRRGPETESPLASLESASSSQRFDLAYWAEQAHQHTSVWERAAARCAARLDARFPNCSTVRLVARWESPPDPPPLPDFHLPTRLEREVNRMRREEGEL